MRPAIPCNQLLSKHVALGVCMPTNIDPASAKVAILKQPHGAAQWYRARLQIERESERESDKQVLWACVGEWSAALTTHTVCLARRRHPSGRLTGIGSHSLDRPQRERGSALTMPPARRNASIASYVLCCLSVCLSVTVVLIYLCLACTLYDLHFIDSRCSRCRVISSKRCSSRPRA